jgi:hypothetical protein
MGKKVRIPNPISQTLTLTLTLTLTTVVLTFDEYDDSD